ncbi:uncharacterized protein LOC34623123 [Cyclospora cayetanensis]|uniref:Uncharacterized protein LOC34623123 n=1 Tax=Cyclospora cayetanensis TaxID=88456 RepID=A0A6P6RSM5_9EIME|nr:uncharacterized protein LOC34623123 [Cyclospora cayetanensis]
MEPSGVPPLPTVAEFEAVVAALQSSNSSTREQAQQLLQRLQQQREDCGELCLAIFEATNDPSTATVAAVLLRSGALWHWNARLAAAAASKKRLAAAAAGEAAGAAANAAAASAASLAQYVSRMQQLMASVVALLQQRAVAGMKGSGERQLTHSFCCLAKKGIATDASAFLSAMKEILSNASAKGPMEPIPLFWLSLLTDVAQEMQQQQQHGMHLTLQQHAACCRSFQQQLLLPLVQFVLQRLQHILDQQQPQQSGNGEIAAILAALDVACSWSFGHLLLRLSSVDELSLTPPAEWIPVFFPAAASAAAAAASHPADAGGVTAAVQPLPQQDGLFVLVLRLYKLLRLSQEQEPELFSTIRYVLQRVAKFRPIAMADALLGGDKEGADEQGIAFAATCPASPLPLKKSYSGPVARSKKQRITVLVYVPLMQVLLDLLESSAFCEQLPGAPAGSQTPQKTHGVSAEILQLEEVQDLCAALANLADCLEAIPEILFDHLSSRVSPLFARLGLGLLDVAAGSSPGASLAAEALALLVRAWSSWVSRLLLAADNQLMPEPPHMQQQQQAMKLTDAIWWQAFRESSGLLVEAFVHKGLHACSQRDDECEGGDAAKRKGVLFLLHGGSQLHEFLKALAQIALACPAKALAAATAKQLQLRQQQQQVRDGAAISIASGGNQQVQTQIALLQQLHKEQHWLLLYIQLLIVAHQGPEALANHRLGPPKQLLQDEAAQEHLLRLLDAVFSTLDLETAALKTAAAAAASGATAVDQQQQFLVQAHQQMTSPVVVEVGLGVVCLVAKAYLFRERLGKPLLADLLLPEGGLKVLNAGVSLSADCLLAAPQHPALSLASARTLRVFADSHNPCCAYLWESAAFQALLDSCCSCCAGLLQPSAAGAPSNNEAAGNMSNDSSVKLRQLSSKSCSSVFAAFAAAAAPSEQLWGLAKRHVAQQQQQQQQPQEPYHRSGTMLSNEVATTRTAALLQRCSVGLGVLQAAAAIAEGSQPLPIPAIRWVLSMLGGLASGAGREGARRLLQWMGPTLRCAFAVTRAAASNPEALMDGLKFSRRVAAAGAGCLTQEEAEALLAEYTTVLAAFSSKLDRQMSPDEEDAAITNGEQIFKLLRQLAGENRGSARTKWVAGSLIECLRALRPLCVALTPTQPKVLNSYLSVVGVLLEDDVALVLQNMTPEDTHVMMTLAERGALSGQARLANAALEAIHVVAMHAADIQLQQGLYSPNLESAEATEGLFKLMPGADSLQQVYVHLAQLATALLQKMPSEQMTAAEQDIMGACLFVALFCIGVRAYALRHLLRSFAVNFAAQGVGSWTGGCSAESLQQRLEELQAAVLEAVREALPKNLSEQGPLPRFKQQYFHKREDAFKHELANFVAEFATFGRFRP